MRKDDGRAIPNFINQMIRNDYITIYGSGNQTRSFCYVDDTVLGIYKTLNSQYKEPINIGNPDEYTINKLIEIIKKLIKNNSRIKYLPLPENDQKIRKPDISLTKKILNGVLKLILTKD